MYFFKSNSGFEQILADSTEFVRSHKSYIMNVNFITSYVKTDGGSFILNNTHEIAVSPGKIEEILSKLSF